jgi:F420-0:gamma-glutamyl ligase
MLSRPWKDRLLKVTYKAENDEILVVATIVKGE